MLMSCPCYDGDDEFESDRCMSEDDVDEEVVLNLSEEVDQEMEVQ
jgi:hypothetical protein